MAAAVDIFTQTNADWSYAFIAELETSPGVYERRSFMGATLKLNVRAQPDAAQALALHSGPGGGIELTEAIYGEFTVTLTKTQLGRILGPGTFVQDLIAEYDDGRTEPVWSGTLVNELGVTRT